MTEHVKLFNRVSALLMALLLLCQFLPYWHYGEEDALSASVNSYVWFPHDHEGLRDEFLAADENYNINGVAYPSVLILILCALGVLLCLWKSGSGMAGLIPAFCGAFGLWAYLPNPAMQAGSMYWVHVLLFAGMLVLGLLGIISDARSNRQAR